MTSIASTLSSCTVRRSVRAGLQWTRAILLTRLPQLTKGRMLNSRSTSDVLNKAR